MLFFSNVDGVNPRKIQWSGIKYHRNNTTYKMLLNICYLVIEGMLIRVSICIISSYYIITIQ